MADAMAMLTSGDIVENIVAKKEDVLKNLQETGMVSKEELEKYKKDPEYFEQQMRGAFDQMAGLFNDPSVLASVTETMTAMSDPAMLEFNKLLEEGMHDDDKLEEARLKLLSNPKLSENPIFEAVFADEEFQHVVKDPKKWRDTFKEGQNLLGKQGLGGGLGMGEL